MTLGIDSALQERRIASLRLHERPCRSRAAEQRDEVAPF
jgi:hypothetical protein